MKKTGIVTMILMDAISHSNFSIGVGNRVFDTDKWMPPYKAGRVNRRMRRIGLLKMKDKI